jgi:hypothetical protein
MEQGEYEMTFENDPNRRIDPDRPGRSRFNYRAEDSFGWVPMILAVAAVAILIMLLLPARDNTSPRVTENAPRTEQPTTPSTPPANKPAPTTPSPTTPAPTQK